MSFKVGDAVEALPAFIKTFKWKLTPGRKYEIIDVRDFKIPGLPDQYIGIRDDSGKVNYYRASCFKESDANSPVPG